MLQSYGITYHHIWKWIILGESSFYFLYLYVPCVIKHISLLILSFQIVPLLQSVTESLVLFDMPFIQSSWCSFWVCHSACWTGAGISHNSFTQKSETAAPSELWKIPTLSILLLYTLEDNLSSTNSFPPRILPLPLSNINQPCPYCLSSNLIAALKVLFWEQALSCTLNQWPGKLTDNHQPCVINVLPVHQTKGMLSPHLYTLISPVLDL